MVYYFKKNNRYYKKYKNGKIVKIKKSDVMKKMKGGNIDIFKNLRKLIADAEDASEANANEAPEKLRKAYKICYPSKDAKVYWDNAYKQHHISPREWLTTCGDMSQYIIRYFNSFCKLHKHKIPFLAKKSGDIKNIIHSYKPETKNLLFRLIIGKKVDTKVDTKDNLGIHDFVILKLNNGGYIIMQSYKGNYSLRDWLTDGDLNKLKHWKSLNENNESNNKSNNKSVGLNNNNNNNNYINSWELKTLGKQLEALESSKNIYGKSEILPSNVLDDFISLVDTSIFNSGDKRINNWCKAFGVDSDSLVGSVGRTSKLVCLIQVFEIGKCNNNSQ